jgi:site-specific recombinase XerD
MRKSVNLSDVEIARAVRGSASAGKPLTYLSKDEVERFFRAIPRVNVRDRLLFELMYRHGLRRAEAARLRLEDISNDRIWITRLKHGVSCEYPLHPRTQKLLAEYAVKRVADSYPYLLRSRQHGSRPLATTTIYAAFRGYAVTASLPADKQHPHVLRHSIAVHLMNAGVDAADVQDWLGHASIATTMIYAQVTNKRREDTFRTLVRSREIAHAT